MKPLIIAGVMSGTSLDGLDIALCRFDRGEGRWNYEILAATTIDYSDEWRTRLAGAHRLEGLPLTILDRQYGEWIGEKVRRYCEQVNVRPDYIASHGHTIFHQPAHGLTLQIGSGATLSAQSGYPAIVDFRTMDVAHGGQGAPLVPVGDLLLFDDYAACLNLGGFANISMRSKDGIEAHDLAPVNIVLNDFARRLDMAYDQDGAVAAGGQVDNDLLGALDALPYYHELPPKSLGLEWVESEVFPLMNQREMTLPDLMATFVEHCAGKIGEAIGDRKTLVTGGGVWNSFLMSRIRRHCSGELIVPSDQLVNYKEALVFALLGSLRIHGEVNALGSVTGADKDTVGGAIYGVV